jgi:outer membrane lipoprotein-sorting protein
LLSVEKVQQFAGADAAAFSAFPTDDRIPRPHLKMTRRSIIVQAATFLVFLAIAVYGFGQQAKPDSELQRTLNQMDAVGKTLRTFTAHLTQKKYTAVLGEFDDTPETGVLYVARAQDGSTLLRRDIASPGKSTLTVKENTAIYYQPDIKTAQIYDLGKHKDKAEYMAAGIGQSPTRLQKDFDITYQGAESVNGIICSVLLLKPKSQDVAAVFSSITLWISKSTGLPVQDKFQEPSGDYTLMTLSDEKLNPKISTSIFDQKLPSDVGIQHL